MLHGMRFAPKIREYFITTKACLLPAFRKRFISDKKIKSNKGNDRLPHLPVPDLKDTLTKYLDTVRPFCSEKEFTECEILVEDFEKNWGPKMQEVLLKRYKEKTNWLGEWWLNYAYLDNRDPLIVYSSPGIYLPIQKHETPHEQYKFIAKMLIATLDYKYLVDNDKLPVDKMGKYPLDMQQYKKLLGTCRIPFKSRDRLVYNDKSTYIIVMHNNHIYHVDLVGRDGVMLNERQIIKTLNRIVRKTMSKNEKGVGILTSEYRDAWAIAYQILMQDEVNKNILEDIQNSMLVVCLDNPVGLWETRNVMNQLTLVGEQTIHGGGARSNGCNRWYDKTLQFISGPEGLSGITYEHSAADGQPVAVLVDHIIKFALEPHKRRKESQKSIKPRRLVFNISPQLVPMLNTAKINLNRRAANLDLNCFKFTNYGKSFIKQHKLSPDAYIQMALQYAFFRLYNIPAATYESSTTRIYMEGRTETIRSCSLDAVEFCKTMLDKHAPLEAKVMMLNKAVKSHRKYTTQALQGHGVDRHLLGLKLAALDQGIKLHDLYSHASYEKSQHMRISTSQVRFNSDVFMCYGPRVLNGYASCYNPRDNYINFALSAFESHLSTNTNTFKHALERSLMDMQQILVNSKVPSQTVLKKK